MLATYYINGSKFDNRYNLFEHLKGEEFSHSFNVSDVSARLNKHNDYKFKRDKNYKDLFELGKKRLLELKATGKKIHFWYSGGMDSHFVLYCMKKFDIWPDTINTYIIDPSDKKLDILHRQEGSPAVEFLKSFGIPENVKCICWDIDSDRFKKTLQLQDFTKYSSIFHFSHIFVTNFFYKTFDDFPVGEEHIHLKGSVTPHIFYDNGWKFYYVDYQFEGVVYGHSEYFIDVDSEFLEAYVNSIINALEVKYGKFNKDIMALLTKNNDRFLKKLCPEIITAYEGISWPQFEKHVKDTITTNNDLVNTILTYAQVKAYDIFKQSYENKLDWLEIYYDNLTRCDKEVIMNSLLYGGFICEIYEMQIY